MKVIQIAIAVDQFANTLIGGMADESLSARAYRRRLESKRWSIARTAIDAIFFWQPYHCRDSYLSELERKQLPPEYSKE